MSRNTDRLLAGFCSQYTLSTRSVQYLSSLRPSKRVEKKPHQYRLSHVISIFTLIGFIAGLFTIFLPQRAYAAGPSFPELTSVGMHNAYDKSRFKYLIDALESGGSLAEIDVWQNFLGSGKYHVSDSAFGNNNNCETATSYSQLRQQDRNQDFSSCLEDIALWQNRHPDHPPMILKLELKNGFDTGSGYSPTRLDAMLAQYLGTNTIFKPADLMGSTYTNPDSATRAGAWPSVSQLTGKIIVAIQAGAFELRVKSYLSDQEYTDHLISLQSSGNLSQAMAFPIYLGSSASDPRPSNNRRPWYVFFGEDASNFVNLDTTFYYTNHYIVIMTNAQSVPPTIDDLSPSVSDAESRVNQLAAHAATIVSSDWTNSTILSYTTPRIHLSYEAEAGNNTLVGGAVVQSCSGCSGGQDVGYIGNGGTLQFNGITVPSSGTYTLEIWYANVDSTARTASISVNGGSATNLSFTPTGSVKVVNIVFTTVSLNAGSNTILFSNASAWAPDIDGIAIK